jgi:hypothetical protein
MPNTTPHELESWGKEVASEFVKDQSKLMTPAIEKIATDNRLNRDQIQRVCEFANHHANEEIIKTATDRTQEFALADVNAIMTKVKDTPDVEVKEASIDFSKLASVKEEIDPMDFFFTPDERVALGVETFSKIASVAPTSSDKAKGILKLAEMRDALKVKEIEYDSDKFEIKQAMVNIVKDLMADGNSFEDLYKAAMASKPESQDEVKALFKDVGDELVKKGHIMAYKLASDKLYLKASEIVKKAEANVEPPTAKHLKGKFQLTMKVGDYVERCKEHALTERSIGYMDDKIRKVREFIRDEQGK